MTILDILRYNSYIIIWILGLKVNSILLLFFSYIFPFKYTSKEILQIEGQITKV